MVVPRPAAADAAHGEALGDLVLLQLGKDGQNADHGPAKGGGGVKILADRHKIGAMGQQLVLNEGQGVLLGAGEPVQLAHHHGVHAAPPDMGEHPPQGRAVGIAAGVAAVHVQLPQGPALGGAERPQPPGLLLNGVVFQLVFGGYPGVARHRHGPWVHSAPSLSE